jgi:hypothetical protein
MNGDACCELMRLCIMGSDGQRVGFDVTIPLKKGESFPIYRYKAGRGRYVAAKLNCCPFCRVAFDARSEEGSGQRPKEDR